MFRDRSHKKMYCILKDGTSLSGVNVIPFCVFPFRYMVQNNLFYLFSFPFLFLRKLWNVFASWQKVLKCANNLILYLKSKKARKYLLQSRYLFVNSSNQWTRRKLFLNANDNYSPGIKLAAIGHKLYLQMRKYDSSSYTNC